MLNKKILVLAYACSPYRGSEPGVGWNRVYHLSKYYDVWVICREEIYKEETQRYLKEHGPIPTLHFEYIKHSVIEKPLLKSRMFYYLGYNLWHRRAYHVAQDLHKQQGFALSHMMVFCGFREPGYLWKLPIPFVWGPIGGVQNYPWRFLLMAGLKGALSEGTRCIANIFQIRFSRYVKNAMNHTKTVLTANSMTANILKSIYNINPIVQIEIGLNNISENNTPNNIGNLKILWSGVFEHRKALHLLMMALSNLPDYVHYELHVLGKGQVEKRWRNIADKLGITKNIRWLGWLPHKEALEQFKWANVFVFTSLRDTTGTVVLEAISNGLPVICLDHQGAADIVTNECGIKVAVTNPAGAIKGLRDALVLLHDDKEKRMALAIGALARAKDFLWENQVEVFKDIYSNAIKITDGVYVN